MRTLRITGENLTGQDSTTSITEMEFKARLWTLSRHSALSSPSSHAFGVHHFMYCLFKIHWIKSSQALWVCSPHTSTKIKQYCACITFYGKSRDLTDSPESLKAGGGWGLSFLCILSSPSCFLLTWIKQLPWHFTPHTRHQPTSVHCSSALLLNVISPMKKNVSWVLRKSEPEIEQGGNEMY